MSLTGLAPLLTLWVVHGGEAPKASLGEGVGAGGQWWDRDLTARPAEPGGTLCSLGQGHGQTLSVPPRPQAVVDGEGAALGAGARPVMWVLVPGPAAAMGSGRRRSLKSHRGARGWDTPKPMTSGRAFSPVTASFPAVHEPRPPVSSVNR